MSDTMRDGLARAIRDAYATDIIPADTLLSDEGWSGLVGSVEEWHPEADAVLAWLAGHPVVGVDAMCAVLRAHQPRSLIDADGLIRQGCTCGLITERRVGAHTFHQAEMVAEVLR